ncbi:MAG: hypothetical protein NC548_56590 [Lachnospiraceae bacterium]|nr:hypothetical protein [Lachnospiraceae bacterium]
MEIKKFGNPEGKTVMLLHGNLMCWRQFEDVIPLLEKEYLVFAVSFDGFDGTEKRHTQPPGTRRRNWRNISWKTVAESWICCLRNPLDAGLPYC